MIKRIDRYIGISVIVGIITVWVALTILVIMFTLLKEMGSAESQPLGDIVWFVALTAPRWAYQVFPVSALLGSLIGLGGLAATNELVSFRTAGASRIRIAGSALGATLLVTIPVLLMGEWLAPAAEEQARAFKHNKLEGQTLFGGSSGIWVRDGADIVNIRQPTLSAERGEHTVEFRNVTFYSFDENARLASITRSRRADHDGQQWVLERPLQTSITDEGVIRERQEQAQWDTGITPELLDSAVTRPRYMSIKALLDQLDYLGSNGLNSRVYQSAFWDKIFYPLTVLSLVLAGMPFVFGSTRFNSMGVRLFVGMSLGGVFMIFSRAFQNMGDAYDLPAMISTSLPALLLAAGVFTVLRRSV